MSRSRWDTRQVVAAHRWTPSTPSLSALSTLLRRPPFPPLLRVMFVLAPSIVSDRIGRIRGMVVRPIGGCRLAQPGSHLLAVLPKRGWWELVARRRARERDRVANHRHRMLARANLDNRAEPEIAREGDTTRDTVDRAAGHTCRAQRVEPLVSGARAQPLDQQRA